MKKILLSLLPMFSQTRDCSLDGCLVASCRQISSLKPSEAIEELRVRIEARRLRRRRKHNKITIKATDYSTSDALHPGDEITKRINLVSWHHGIYLGDGKVCERNTDTPPNVITLERFLSGEDELQVLLYKRDSDEARADSLAMALMATEERVWKDVPYDILGNNCEHFTHFCRVGKKFSVQAAVMGGGIGVLGAAVLGPVEAGVLLYGAYKAVNRVCLNMISDKDDEDKKGDGGRSGAVEGEDGGSESSSDSESEQKVQAAGDDGRSGAVEGEDYGSESSSDSESEQKVQAPAARAVTGTGGGTAVADEEIKCAPHDDGTPSTTTADIALLVGGPRDRQQASPEKSEQAVSAAGCGTE